MTTSPSNGQNEQARDKNYWAPNVSTLKVTRAPTGALNLNVDDESFALMTPEGHTFAGWVTFSAYDDGCTVAQVTAQLRATDPIYELGMRLGAHKMEDKHWAHTLQALAADFGV